MMAHIICGRIYSLFFGVVFLLGLSGCVATREWVGEQLAPVVGRVSDGEKRANEMGGKVSGLEGRLGQTDAKLGQTDAKLGQTDAKAESALQRLANLKLERRFVLDMKEGANFAFNKAELTAQAKREIDSFLSDLKGDLKGGEGAMYLIAGHTDGVGSDDYNYELGRKRADSVTRHLIISKKIDPMRVVTVSYGKSAPLAANATKDGRKKNRRVEILVYREGIASGAAEPRAEAQLSEQPDKRISVR
jgi:outer membrane protein OmpA-like peptidoglycan-associated protein